MQQPNFFMRHLGKIISGCGCLMIIALCALMGATATTIFFLWPQTSDAVAETTPQYPPAVTTTITGAPQCPATTDGSTNCECLEEWLTSQLLVQYGIEDAGLLGTEQFPLVYPSWWLHDSCFAWTNGGTGAKVVTVEGPIAGQVGEAAGALSMVWVPKGEVFSGWLNAFWKYATEPAMGAQWVVENEETQKWGLICGYQKAMNQFVPAFRWDGQKEVRDESLDCQLGKAPTPTPTSTPSLDQWLQNIPAVTATLVAPPAPAPTATANEDSEDYPEVFKAEFNSKFLCGAKAKGVNYPPEARLIETWPKNVGDANYLHDAGDSGMSSAGFCKGTAENGQPWTQVLLTSEGFVPTSFPLPPLQ